MIQGFNGVRMASDQKMTLRNDKIIQEYHVDETFHSLSIEYRPLESQFPFF